MKGSMKENWFKIGILLILFVVIGLTAFLYNKKLSEQQKLEADKLLISRQSDCADRATKSFKELGYDVAGFDSYTSHWSSNLKKCFMLTQSHKIYGSVKTISDVLEGKIYGTIEKLHDTPDYCEIYPNGDLTNLYICHSEKEFDDSIKTYMNN